MKVKYLHMDARPSEQPEGSYAYGKNGIIDYLTDSIRNEPGLTLMAAVVPYQLMGIIETDNNPILFSTNDTDSAIGLFNTATGAYDAIINDNPAALVNWPANGERLGFKKDNYITGEAQRNYKGQLVTAFTDKTRFPKYLNCDAPNIKNLTDLRLFPYFKSPLVSLNESTGGNLPAGTYYVAISYEKSDGTVTPKSDVSDGVTISSGTFSTVSEKSIAITITEADTNYEFIRLYVISVIDGKTSTKELTDVVPVSGGTIQVLYTGTNLSQEVSLSEVLTPGAIYSTIGTMGQMNDSLYGAELTVEKEILDMQPYASQIEIKFRSDLISVVSPPPEHIQGKKKGMMHEEVYAVYVRYKLATGGFTKAFLTIGQPAIATDLDFSTDATTGGYEAVQKYKVEDTVRNFNALDKSGTPGTWLNSVEKYPGLSSDPTDPYGYNSIPSGGTEDLRGTPVRHHKMPSLRWCKTNLYSGEPTYGKDKLDLLGLYANNVLVPAKYTGIIVGYQLLYAKRSPSSSIVQAQGALLHPATIPAEAAQANGVAPLYSTGGNFRSRVMRNNGGTYSNVFGLQELTGLRLSAMRFHAFDLLFNKPGITPSMISGQYKMATSNVGYIDDNNLGKGQSRDSGITLLVDYTDPFASPVVSNPVNSRLRKITQSFYLEIGINISGFVNIRHETCFAGFLGGANWSQAEPTCGYVVNDPYTRITIGRPVTEETYLINLISVKQDLYAGFQNQVLISAGKVRTLGDTGISATFFAGDTFACAYTFHTYGRYNSDDIDGDGIRGRRVIRRIACESVSNIHLRYEIPANNYSKWYPHSPIVANAEAANYTQFLDRQLDPNQIGYSKSLNALNEFVSTSPFNPYIESIGSFPFRIHRFGKVSRQSKFRNWRTALPLDYYECQKNMGRIINLDSLNDRLIIHHENALFVTQDKAKLEGGGLVAVTIGAGDIFQFEPQMVVDSKLGFGGTQHELSCVKIPPGYVFADVKLNMFFLYSGGKLINLGDKYISIFLQKYLNVTGTNNYTGSGVTIGWDPTYSRILFTVNTAGTPVFTLSYSVGSQKWAFFHDYFPAMYINTRKELFSSKTNTGVSVVQKHNAGPVGQYLTGSLKSFFVDVTFRAETDLLAETIQWKTDYITEGTTDTDSLTGTLTHIAVWNSHQHSGRITLQNYNPLDIQDIRRTKGVWSFNSFRDILETKGIAFLDSFINDYNLIGGNVNKPWYDKELLSDTWFCVRFEFNNNQNRKVVLHDTALQATKSLR